MAIDPSIALQVGQGQQAPNLLGMAGQAVGINNALAQNKLMGVQTQAAQQGVTSAANAEIARQAFSLYGIAKQDPKKAWDMLHGQILPGLISQNYITPQDAQATDSYLGGTTGLDHFADRIFRLGAGALGIPQQAEQMAGTVAPVNTGGTTQFVTTPGPMARLQGAQPPAPLTNTLSPGENASGREITMPDGSKKTVPLSSVVTPTGQDKTVGGYPVTGGVSTGLPTGTPEDIRSNQETYRTAVNDIPAAQKRLQGLDKAREAADLALTTGPGSAGVQKLLSFLSTAGIPVGAEDAKNYDLLRKYTLDYAQRSAGGTDKSLDTAIHSNASPEITRAAIKDVLATNIGRERLDLAATQMAPDGGSNFLKHKGDYYSKYDPVAFAADQYTYAELQKHVAGLKSEAAKKRFYDGLAEANTRGFPVTPRQ